MQTDSDTIFDIDGPLIQGVFDKLDKNGLPNDVLRLDRERGEDSDGEPVWWIWVTVSASQRPSSKKIRGFVDFSNLLQNTLIEAGVRAQPYVKFSEYKPRVKRNAVAR